MKTRTISARDGRRLELPVLIFRLAVRISGKYLITLEELAFGRIAGRRTNKSVAHARHELWALTMAACPSMSYPDAGRLFGVDHTSVLRGRNEYERRVVAAGPGPGG